MKEYKLIKVLKRLPPQKIDRLMAYIHSPYFKINDDTGSFLKHIVLNHRKQLNYEQIWNETQKYPYNQPRLRKMLHDCLLIIEDFLGIESYRQSPLNVLYNKLKASKDYFISELIPRLMNQYGEELKNQKTKNVEYYFNKLAYLLFVRNLINPFERKVLVQKNGLSEHAISEYDQTINELFTLEKYRLNFLTLEDRKIINANNQLTFLNETNIIAEYQKSDSLLINFYFNLSKLAESTDILSDIDDLHIFLFKNHHLFEIDEYKILHIFLLNAVVPLWNSGNKKAEELIFDIQKTAIEKDVFLTNNGLLTPDIFRNVVSSATRLKKFEWAEYFIEEYAFKLDPKYRENSVTYCKAILYANKKDYEKVVDLLRFVEYEDLGYLLNSKSFLLLSYYYLGEDEALYSGVKSFLTLLRRKRNIAKRRSEAFQNFTSTLLDLSRIRMRKDKVKLAVVRKRLESGKTFVNKKPLLEIVAALEDQFGIIREEKDFAQSGR